MPEGPEVQGSTLAKKETKQLQRSFGSFKTSELKEIVIYNVLSHLGNCGIQSCLLSLWVAYVEVK